MPKLTLSEIRQNAITFASEWKDVSSERAEAQTFWNQFFKVFGIHRPSVASFEEKVRNLGGAFDRIDVFWAGVMLGEHKSLGQDLSKATSQAFNYVQLLTNEQRNAEIPRHIVVSDFAQFVIYDLESNDPTTPIAKFATKKLHENIGSFGFISGYETSPTRSEDPINIRAVEILGKLHDSLEDGGLEGHDLEQFLVRVLFCLFAEDTGIFDPDAFRMIVDQSRTDGSDLGATLAHLFAILNTPTKKRARNLTPEQHAFPYVNGSLFEERLGFAAFNSAMRSALLKCCDFNWGAFAPQCLAHFFSPSWQERRGDINDDKSGPITHQNKI